MALEAAFRDLEVQSRRLYETLGELRLMIVEDKPELGESVLVDTLGDTVEDLLGWLTEALAAASQGRRAVTSLADPSCAQQQLVRCQERFNRIAERFFAELVSYEQLAELLSAGQERGGEWQAWAWGVKEALENCRQPVGGVNQALFCCWRAVTEQSGVPLRTANL